jgi:hypothetical protein
MKLQHVAIAARKVVTNQAAGNKQSIAVLVKKCFAKNATRWSIVESVMSISVRITIALSIVKLVIYVIVDLVDVTRDAVYMEWRVTRTTFVSQRSLPPSGRNSCSTNERITTYANI